MPKKQAVENLIELVHKLNFVVRDKLKSRVRPCPLSPLHLRTLKFVHHHGHATMKSIADYLLITPPSATSLVENLVEKGLIKREADKTDRRMVRLVMTPKGKQALVRGLEAMKKRMEAVVGILDEKDIIKLNSILGTILNRINKQ
jgi:DNA-binding MarR family transcriptional regulator